MIDGLGEIPREQEKANARAIAAVPGLLAALEDAYTMLYAIRLKEGYPGILHNDCQDAEQQAKSALIKAGYTFP